MNTFIKIVFLIIISITSIAQADFVTIKINGTVKDVGNPSIKGYINIGDSVTATYTYDTTVVDTNPDPSTGDYQFNSPPNGIELTVDNYVFKMLCRKH